MNNEIKNIDTDFEVVSPNQKEIDTTKHWLKEKREYLECISKQHPSYKITLNEINQLKLRLKQIKTK